MKQQIWVLSRKVVSLNRIRTKVDICLESVGQIRIQYLCPTWSPELAPEREVLGSILATSKLVVFKRTWHSKICSMSLLSEKECGLINITFVNMLHIDKNMTYLFNYYCFVTLNGDKCSWKMINTVIYANLCKHPYAYL